MKFYDFNAHFDDFNGGSNEGSIEIGHFRRNGIWGPMRGGKRVSYSLRNGGLINAGENDDILDINLMDLETNAAEERCE